MTVPRSVVLLNQTLHDGSRLHLSATLDSDGDLLIEGQDLGPVTKPVSPDGEYEYCYTIHAVDVPTLITALGGSTGEDVLELLQARWAGGKSYGLGEAIRGSGVRFDFWCYS